MSAIRGVGLYIISYVGRLAGAWVRCHDIAIYCVAQLLKIYTPL